VLDNTRLISILIYQFELPRPKNKMLVGIDGKFSKKFFMG
jgi:hypothetical protein